MSLRHPVMCREVCREARGKWNVEGNAQGNVKQQEVIGKKDVHSSVQENVQESKEWITRVSHKKVSHKKVVHEPVFRILARCREELYSLVYRALLQKRATILRSLQIVATPYTNQDLQSWQEVERSSYGWLRLVGSFKWSLLQKSL